MSKAAIALGATRRGKLIVWPNVAKFGGQCAALAIVSVSEDAS